MFESLTKPRFSKNGICLSEDWIAVASSVATKAVESPDRYGVVTTPEGALQTGFIESNILDFDALADSISECVEKAGLANKKDWSVALPNGSTRVAVFSFETEPASERELKEMLEWKSESAFGTDSKLLRLSAEKVSNDLDGKKRYIVSSIALEVLAEYEELFAHLGWTCGLYLPRCLAESSLIGSSDRANLLVSGMRDGFVGIVFRERDPIIVRSVSCSAEEVSDELFRLLMFYSDRYGPQGWNLESIAVCGLETDENVLVKTCEDSLGYSLPILDEFGFEFEKGRGALTAAIGIAAVGG